MKNLSKIGLLVLILALALTSCKKEIKETPLPEGVALKKAIKEKRDSKRQTFAVDLTAGQEIVGEQGTKINFYAGSLLDAQGNIVTGNVEIELLEIYSKADMLLMNKATMGRLPNGDKAILISGGEIELTATQAGEDLNINGALGILFPAENTGGADNDMELFSNTSDEECGDAIICKDDAWVENEDTVGAVDGIFIEHIGGEDFYHGFVSQFGWTNVDRFYSYSGEKTVLKVQAPEGYDNTNCAIYLSYDGEGTALASLDTYLADEGLFSEHYGQIPVGLDIHVIAISIVEDDYFTSIKSATIAAGGIIVLDDFQTTTEADLTTAIENLP